MEMVMVKYCRHGGFCHNRRAEALSRIEKYNCLVDSVQKSIKIYTKNFDNLKKPLGRIVRNYGFGDLLIIFLDINQLDEYWVGVSQDGSFYDGWDCFVGEKTNRRINLSHIDIEDEAAWSDTIYSDKDNGEGCFLDYCTLLAVRNCLKMSLYPIISHSKQRC